MEKLTLEAKLRTELKKNKVKVLRNDGYVPGVIYGNGKGNINVYVKENDYIKALNTPFKRNTILTLVIDNNGKTEEERVITYQAQKEIIKPNFTHIDFLRVEAGKEVALNVPLKLVGVAPGTKQGGYMIKKMDSVKIKAAPENIPPFIEIDLSSLGLGEFIAVKDIKLSNITVLTPEDNSIVRIAAPRSQQELDSLDDEVVSSFPDEEGEEGSTEGDEEKASAEDAPAEKEEKKEDE